MMGLRFLLRYGLFLDTVFGSYKEMRTILDHYTSGYYKLKDIRALSGKCQVSGMEWVISTDDIVAVHTFQVQSVAQGPTGQQQPQFGSTFVSGPQRN